MENNLKYIVYETRNIVNNKIYIGVHKTITPYIFDGYLGCGVLATQPNTYEKAKTHFQFAVKKHGVKNFKRATLACFDKEEDAYLLEEQLVNEEYLKRNDVYNMILGGSNGLFKPLAKKVYLYDINGNYVKCYNSYYEASINFNTTYSVISTVVRKKTFYKDYFFSLEYSDNIDTSQWIIYDTKKPVHKYNKKGHYIKSFNSLTDAAKIDKVSITDISRSCRFGYKCKSFYYSFVKDLSFDKANTLYVKTREVHQFDKDGKYITTYTSQEIAEKKYKYSLSKHIRLKTIDKNNYFWGLEKLQYYNVPKNTKRSVGKYDKNDNLIFTYDSASFAVKENGKGVWHALRNGHFHKQHKYKYLS